MLTKNYYERLLAYTMCTNGNGFNRVAKNTDGKDYRIACPSNTYISNMCVEEALKMVIKNGYYGTGVVFGTGTAEPTVDDYKLSGNMVTGFSCTVDIIRESTANGGKITAIYTITNNNAHDITISEVAMCHYIMTGSSSNGGYAVYDRTLLETPITIPANSGVGQVTYSICMDLPNFT